MPRKVRNQSARRKKPEAEPGAIAEQVYFLKALVLGNGACLFENWLHGIRDTETKQRIQSRLDRVERGNLGDCAPVGEGVYEFRLMFGPGFRIYYAITGGTLVVLLVGGDKSSQDKDIALAQQLWKDNKDDSERYGRDIRC